MWSLLEGIFSSNKHQSLTRYKGMYPVIYMYMYMCYILYMHYAYKHTYIYIYTEANTCL